MNKIKESAVRILARRDHSPTEIRNKLRQKFKITPEQWSEVLEYLNRLGYLIPEENLAKRWVKQWRSEGRGRLWIVGKLKTKGLPSAHLHDDDEELEAARKFLQKKLKSGHELKQKQNMKEKARIMRSMISRGFSTTVVASVMREDG